MANLSEMREMSEATEMADSFLAKSVDNFLLTKIDDLRRPPLAMVCGLLSLEMRNDIFLVTVCHQLVV